MQVGIPTAEAYVVSEAPPDRIPRSIGPSNCHGTLSRLDLHHVLLLTDVVVRLEFLLKEQ